MKRVHSTELDPLLSLTSQIEESTEDQRLLLRDSLKKRAFCSTRLPWTTVNEKGGYTRIYRHIYLPLPQPLTHLLRRTLIHLKSQPFASKFESLLFSLVFLDVGYFFDEEERIGDDRLNAFEK